MLTLQKTVSAVLGICLWLLLILTAREWKGSVEKYLQKTVEKKLRETPVQKKLRDTTGSSWLKQRIEEVRYLIEPLDMEIVFERKVWIRPGDKVYLTETQSEAGIVYAVAEETVINAEGTVTKWVVYIRIYPRFVSQVGKDSTFTMVKQPADVEWIIKKLLEPHVEELKKDFGEYLQNHAGDIKEHFSPILNEMARESCKILEKNFPQFIQLHREDLLTHLKRIKALHIDDELPVIQEIIWPILRVECEREFLPVIEEMWQKFPKWNIAWAWVKDQVGTENANVKEILKIYMDETVYPILNKHKKRLESIPITTLQKAWEDERMKKSVKDLIGKILHDDDILNLLKKMVIDIYKQNEAELIAQFQTKWNSPELQEKIKTFSLQLEPYIQRMVDKIIRESGKREISTDFANVLRRKIFFKDCFCIYMTPSRSPNEFFPKRVLGN